jgi:FkbM family methyltransferase
MGHLNIESIYFKKKGVMQYRSDKESGEEYFLTKVLPDILQQGKSAVVLDVGANEGNYASLVCNAIDQCVIHCFEPNPKTARRLAERFRNDRRLTIHPFGFGESPGELVLYDYADQEGSAHATIYKDVLIEQHRATAMQEVKIPVETIDNFCSSQLLSAICLLKVDTEGHELSVLRGATELISKRKIDVIQFEFNEMNVISRVFLRDFYTLLPGYNFFRLREDGLIELGAYSSCNEIFQFNNIIALRQDLITPVFQRHILKSIW